MRRIAVDGAPVEIHVASFDAPTESPGDLADLLDEGERVRAARFSFDEPRMRFIVSRGLLRRVLEGAGAGSAASLRFETGPHGKPRLLGENALRFNVSHSADLWACAVSRGPEVGLDIEQRHPGRDFHRLAPRFFSASEAAQVMDVEGDERVRTFYRCWTRKEAWLKARGFGITIPLDSFEVTVDADGPPRLLRSLTEPDAPQHWSLHAVDVGPDHEGCLAVATSAAPRPRSTSPHR
jgi:4'-phosphopantetheinyl transferase